MENLAMATSESTAAAESPWIDGMTIGQVLEQTAEKRGDADCLVFPAIDFRMSFREFRDEVRRVARGLLAMGIGHGDHVAIWATNVPQWVVLQFATAEIGAVLVTVNPAYRPFELKYVLEQSDAVALFLVRSFKSSNYFEMLAEVCPELAEGEPGKISSEQFPKLRAVVGIDDVPPAGALSWDQVIQRGQEVDEAELDIVAAALDAGQKINIQYTSGTTGFPKAATLSHRNLLLNAYYIGECQRMTEQDRICIPVPFYHCFGCVLGTLCAAVYGTAMIVPAESFNPAVTLDAIEKERATVIYGVPTMFIAQLEDELLESRDLTSLRTGIMAGSPCPIEIMRKVIDKMGASEVTIAYGQTEASPVVTQTRTDDPLELRVETVGRTIPGVEAKIVNPETGEELGDNEQGEFCSRGHVVMIGYYKDEEATRRAIDADGWLHSGDLAVRLPNGYYKITGRIKDMVIRGGENIYPREIEEFLFTHDAIEQAAVVGVPDKKYGEELCAWIRLKSGFAGNDGLADELRTFCRDNLARFKVPRYIRFVDAFPQTVTGKIQKFKIREAMIDELGLEEAETA
ncbi:MAG: AMP-binding protein [Pirellulales bacterium]